MTLDANVLAAAGAVVAVTGTAITLLAPQAATEYQTYIGDATDENHRRAFVWSRVTRTTPIIALVPIVALFTAAVISEHGLSAVGWTVVVVTIFVQLGFAYLIRLLVAPVRREMPLLENLQSVAPSARSRQQTAIQFDNQLLEELAVDWVDPKGGYRDYGSIPPYQVTPYQTYAGHVWLIRDAQRSAVLGVFRAGSVPGKAILRRPPADPRTPTG